MPVKVTELLRRGRCDAVGDGDVVGENDGFALSDEVEIEIAVEGPAAVVGDLEAVEVGLLCRVRSPPVQEAVLRDFWTVMVSLESSSVKTRFPEWPTVVRPVPAASASPKSLMARQWWERR